MTLDDIIARRRSIRNYGPQPVEDEKINAILEAGRLAPSARNQQCWRFTLVKSKDLLPGLCDACNGQQMIAQAPLALVVWATADRIMACGQSSATVDCSIALSFMMLKATELGLGSCWLGSFQQEGVKALLNLPDDATVVAVTPLGYPAEQPAPRPRKPLDELATLL